MANILPLSQFLAANPLVGVLGFGQSDVLRRAPDDVTAPPVMLEREPLPLAEPGPQVGVRQFPNATPPLMYDQASQNRAMDMISGLIPPAQGALAQQEVPGMGQQDAPLIPDQPVPNMWANSPPVFPQGPMPQQPPIPQAAMGPQPGPQPGPQQALGPQQRAFIEPQAQQVVQQGRRGMSDAAMWGLLSAGLGILQNNYGKYGQAGPAIGAGGMQGVNTFLGVRQQEVENQRRDLLAQQQGEYQRAQIEAQQANTALQGRRVDIEEQRERQKQLQELQSRQLALMLAGPDQEQQRIALANPDKYLDFKVAQLKPEYKERSIKDGDTAYDEYSDKGGMDGTWKRVPGGGKYDLRAAKGGSDISLKVAEKQGEAFTKPIAEQVDVSYTKAQDAVKNQRELLRIESNLKDPRLISGVGANQRLAVAQVAEFFGGEGADVAVTRSTVQGLAELTLNSRSMLKGQGQVTDREQSLLERARSGDITMTVPELKALVGVFKRMNKAQYDAHQDVMRRLSGVKGTEQASQFYQPEPFPDNAESPKPWQREY
jgi:hypothetical protein